MANRGDLLNEHIQLITFKPEYLKKSIALKIVFNIRRKRSIDKHEISYRSLLTVCADSSVAVDTIISIMVQTSCSIEEIIDADVMLTHKQIRALVAMHVSTIPALLEHQLNKRSKADGLKLISYIYTDFVNWLGHY